VVGARRAGGGLAGGIRVFGRHGARFRRTIGPWRNGDLKGRPLLMNALSTKLTKVDGYRQTLCSLEPEAARYLQR
jgi:hypothetical protein